MGASIEKCLRWLSGRVQRNRLSSRPCKSLPNEESQHQQRRDPPRPLRFPILTFTNLLEQNPFLFLTFLLELWSIPLRPCSARSSFFPRALVLQVPSKCLCLICIRLHFLKTQPPAQLYEKHEAPNDVLHTIYISSTSSSARSNLNIRTGSHLSITSNATTQFAG